MNTITNITALEEDLIKCEGQSGYDRIDGIFDEHEFSKDYKERALVLCKIIGIAGGATSTKLSDEVIYEIAKDLLASGERADGYK